jgi:ABC-type nitrate/sulfonate/bicarbonate transport system ATPase subunit
MARISVRRVGKTFASRHGDVEAQAGITLDIADQEFVSIVGASGCGKTTLLNLLAGFDTATSGEIAVDGAPVAGPGPDRGVVFQQTALFPWLSVEDNIAFGLRPRANRHKGYSRCHRRAPVGTHRPRRRPAACASARRSPASSPSIRRSC